MKVVNRRN